MGGGINSGVALGAPSAALTQRFDPVRARFARSGDLQRVRSGDYAATLLADGRVLVTGGQFCCTERTEFVNGTAEIFDPATGSFALTGKLQQERAFHRATLLAEGRVLLSGGFVGPSQATAGSEIFDPATGKFSTANSPQVPRVDHSALLLRDGRVLVVAGFRA